MTCWCLASADAQPWAGPWAGPWAPAPHSPPPAASTALILRRALKEGLRRALARMWTLAKCANAIRKPIVPALSAARGRMPRTRARVTGEGVRKKKREQRKRTGKQRKRNERRKKNQDGKATPHQAPAQRFRLSIAGPSPHPPLPPLWAAAVCSSSDWRIRPPGPAARGVSRAPAGQMHVAAQAKGP